VTSTEKHAKVPPTIFKTAAANRRITLPPRFGWKAQLHCKKKVCHFPARMYSRPGRVWLVTSQLGTGKSLTFFYSVGGLHTWSRGFAVSTRSGTAATSPSPHSARRLFSTPSSTLTHSDADEPYTRLKEDLLPAAHAHQVSQGDGWLSREMGG
jgi:hypothetical protein